tara:strand:+ start:271 stop:708 length:438 start_codon:yes stop_codon:yes gene_type:complete
MKIPAFSILCSIAYVLGRCRSDFRRHARGGKRAEGGLDGVSVAIIRHFAMSGWGITGINSAVAAAGAITRGLGAATAGDMADLAQAHCKLEGSQMRVATCILEAVRAAGGNVERVKPLDVWHTSPPMGPEEARKRAAYMRAHGLD